MAQTHRDLACGPPAGEDGQIREIFEYDETAWGGREELGHSGHGPQGGMSIGSEGSGGDTGGRDLRRVAGHDQGRPVRPGFLLRGPQRVLRTSFVEHYRIGPPNSTGRGSALRTARRDRERIRL